MYTQPTDLITIEECVNKTGLSKSKIYEHVKDWTIPFLRIKGSNRLWFSVSELETYFLPKRSEKAA